LTYSRNDPAARLTLGLLSLVVAVFAVPPSCPAQKPPLAAGIRVTFAGYPGCVRLENATTRVTIVPQSGARVLEYSLQGRNVMHLNPAQDGWTYVPGKPGIDPCGGRLDFGPEFTAPRHSELMLGPWQVVAASPRFCRLVSPVNQATGVQLIREFALASTGSHLRCTQTIHNGSSVTKHWFHWSRTLALAGGVFVVPLNPESRFPKGYLRYGPGPILSYQPEADPLVHVRDGFLELTGAPREPKYGVDSVAGWLAYITPNDVLFIKRFPVYPERLYGEVAPFTVCVYYNQNIGCELEPLGPRENILPGRSVSFTEDWYLLDQPCPKADTPVDLRALTARVTSTTGQ
jgi:hypothetical protein